MNERDEDVEEGADGNITITENPKTPEEDEKEKSLFSKLIGGDDDGDDNGNVNATSPVIHESEEGGDDVLQKRHEVELDDQYESETLEPGTLADVDDKEITEEEEQKEEEAEDEEEDEEREEEEEMGMMPVVQTKEDILKAEQEEAAAGDQDDMAKMNLTKFDNEEMDDAEYNDTDDEDVSEVTDDIALQRPRRKKKVVQALEAMHLQQHRNVRIHMR